MCMLVLAYNKSSYLYSKSIVPLTTTHNNNFRIDAREFLVTLLEKMFDKNPISFHLFKYASVLDPKVLVSQPLDVCKSLFQRLLFTLVHLRNICSSQADPALSEFPPFYHTSLRERKTSFESFQKERDRLDDFYVKETNIVLVLRLGQAAVEREFSVNSKVLNVNMHEISITSLN